MAYFPRNSRLTLSHEHFVVVARQNAADRGTRCTPRAPSLSSEHPQRRHPMGHPRPRPIAEASPLVGALETVAPLLEQLEAFEDVRRLLTVAFRYRKEIEQVLTEHPRVMADDARRKAKERELANARTDIIDAARALERSGVVVKLPPSLPAALS